MTGQNGQMPPSHEIAGTLEPEERGILDGLRSQADGVVRQIGELEIRKARLLGALSDMETRSQTVLGAVQKRLNIPEGRRWHTVEDKVFIESASPVPEEAAPEASSAE